MTGELAGTGLDVALQPPMARAAELRLAQASVPPHELHQLCPDGPGPWAQPPPSHSVAPRFSALRASSSSGTGAGAVSHTTAATASPPL